MRGAIVLLMAGLMLVGGQPRPAATAPAALTLQYAEQPCGFSFRYPQGWLNRKQRDNTVVVLTPEQGREFHERGVVVFIGPIRDVRITEVSADQLAQSALGGYCLLCLQGRLAWVDRLTDGPLTIRYLMEERDLTEDGVTVPHYRLQFYLADNGTSRALAPNGWTWARAVAWIPVARYAEMHETVVSVVRSLRFTVPAQPESVCWPPQQST